MVCCFTDSDAGAQQLSQSSCLLGVVESFVLLVQSSKQLTRCWDVFDVRHAVSIPCLTVVCAVANLCCAVQISAVRGNMPKIPQPKTRPDLVDASLGHQYIKVYEDKSWIVRDLYIYGLPTNREAINLQLDRTHPKCYTRTEHPDEKRASHWIWLLILPWPIFWVVLHNLEGMK